MPRKTQEQFIIDAKAKHGEKYDYLNVIYETSKSKIKIICGQHGEFIQNANGHLNGQGCPECGKQTIIKKRSMPKSEFITNANVIHNNKYDYSQMNYVKASEKVKIICPEHGEFNQLAYMHLQGQACPKCGFIKKGISNRVGLVKFIERSNKTHNNKYNYSLSEYKTNKDKVIIICPEHGKFQQAPDQHMSGEQCPECGKIISSIKRRVSQKDIIKKANKIHNNKYDYSKVIYTTSDLDIIIICSKHGEFTQRVNNHLNGAGCYKCGKINAGNTLADTTEDFIIKSKKKHGEKYDYSKVKYDRVNKIVIIICPKHGEFEKTASAHMQGYGCNKCNLCTSCHLWKTNGELCMYCKPAKTNKLYKKTYEKSKEFEVVKFLKEKLPDTEFIHNQSIGTECTKDEKPNSSGHLFPDIRFDCGFYHLIVEIDEHKHRGSNYECDKQRMYNIIAKLGLPCIFIRYNPDNINSNKNQLLNKLKKYLKLKLYEKKWDDFGFKSKYMYY